MDSIGIFDIKFSTEEKEKFYKYCDQIFEEAYFTNHTFSNKFEGEFSKFAGTKHSLAVPSGTAALELALRTVGVKGKKVILPTNTFIATAIAVLNAGGTPVILDVEKDYFGLCPKALSDADLSEVAAVITVHIGGHISPHIKEICKLCDEKNIPLIEDSAHAHGAELDGTKAGHFGIAGCFSHFLTKVMTTGEGGSLVTNDQKFYDLAFSLKRFGFDPENSILHVNEGGTNFKFTEMQAALGLIELERINERIQKRRAIAKIYHENLDSNKWNVLSDNKGGSGSYYKQIVLPKSGLTRDSIETKLKKLEIPLTGGVYNTPLHLQPIMKSYVVDENFPVADKFCQDHICPPCYPELSTEQVNHICESLNKL